MGSTSIKNHGAIFIPASSKQTAAAWKVTDGLRGTTADVHLLKLVVHLESNGVAVRRPEKGREKTRHCLTALSFRQPTGSRRINRSNPEAIRRVPGERHISPIRRNLNRAHGNAIRRKERQV